MGQAAIATSYLNREALRLIRASFAEAGVTQAVIARAAGMPRSSLANLLSPTAEPRLVHVDQMVRIAVALGADPRVWIGELEALEKRRQAEVAGDEVAPRRRARGQAAQVQKRAARSRSDKGKLGKE